MMLFPYVCLALAAVCFFAACALLVWDVRRLREGDGSNGR